MAVLWVDYWKVRAPDRAAEGAAYINAIVPIAIRCGARPGNGHIYTQQFGADGELANARFMVSTAFDNYAEMGAWIDKLLVDPEFRTWWAMQFKPDSPCEHVARTVLNEWALPLQPPPG